MKLKVEYEIKTDILIIGGGGAGIKASLKASENGAEVLIVTKFPFGRTGATFYPGTPGWGMNAILFDDDTPDDYYNEILEAGAGAEDRRLSRILADECTLRFHELEHYGLTFNRDTETGNYIGVIPCFGKKRRGSVIYGMERIRNTLWVELNKRKVSVRSGISIISLIKDGDTCIGAVGFDELTHLVFFRAKAVILCTGGGSSLFTYGLATPDQSGDGCRLALEAGARLTNMEFIQFIPGLTWPVKKLLFQEKNLDTFPVITNSKDEEVLHKYLPTGVKAEDCLIERAKHGPFSIRTISRYFDIALYEEWLAGRALESGGIHVRYSPKIREDKRWSIESWLNWMRSRGVDPIEQGFDLIPHAQCFNGGIYISEDASAGVPGLYAAGENAGGPHGADRLGGAAIAATQVFGARAGEAASRFAAGSTFSSLGCSEAEYQVNQIFTRSTGGIVDIKKSLDEIRNIMWENAGIARKESRCSKGLERLSQLEDSFDPMAHFEQEIEIRKVSELCSYLTLSKLVLQAINTRKESRGPHYREDYPQSDDRFRGMQVISKEGGEIRIDFTKS